MELKISFLFTGLLLSLLTDTITQANCPRGQISFRNQCHKTCSGCEFKKPCNVCGPGQLCVLNGENGICKHIPRVKLIPNCQGYSTLDQTSIQRHGYLCGKCDSIKGYSPSPKNHACINYCTLCFDPDFRGLCKKCPHATRCTYSLSQ